MPRRLIVVNAAFVLLAVIALGYALRELRVPPPQPNTAKRSAPAATAGTTAAPVVAVPPGGYNVVASRNLFSPTRSEAPATAVAAGPPVAKPNLYGILMIDPSPVAYLEDPMTKRVAAYRLGDTVAGGTLTQIAPDHVVLNRPEGDINVRLRDPAKPRLAAPATPGQPQPGGAAPIAPTTPGAVGVPTQPGASSQPAPQPQPPVPSVVLPPGTPPVLPRRPLPPNLSRRLPPAGSDAPPQN